MKLHRFYTGDELVLEHEVWLHDQRLLHQWRRVMRYRPGSEVVLFDGRQHERLYEVIAINDTEAHLKMVTEFERKLPKREVYLLWSLLKKDKNDWVIQKCTEQGVRHFLPLITERSERNELSMSRMERWRKIAIEAAEQCGRSDIPTIREPVHLETALKEFDGKVPLLVCDETGKGETWMTLDRAGILVGPEGGWSEKEKQLFDDYHIPPFSLHDFTLRAETACVVAAAKLLQ